MIPLIDGPRIAARGAKPNGLVVILHGYGADGADLIGLGRAWAETLPDVAFAAPDAPEDCAHMPGGRQWFPLDLRDPREYWSGCIGARDSVDSFLDAELARFGLNDDRLIIAGFSQGAMMALHVGLRRRKPPAAIIAYSGRMAGLDRLHEMTARPPVTLIHGLLDDVIHPVHSQETARALQGLGLNVDLHVIEDIGHEIDNEGTAIGQAAVVRGFAANDAFSHNNTNGPRE